MLAVIVYLSCSIFLSFESPTSPTSSTFEHIHHLIFLTYQVHSNSPRVVIYKQYKLMRTSNRCLVGPKYRCMHNSESLSFDELVLRYFPIKKYFQNSNFPVLAHFNKPCFTKPCKTFFPACLNLVCHNLDVFICTGHIGNH